MSMSNELQNLVRWVLSKQDPEEPDMSNLKLQKLLFYLDGCFSAVHGRHLFPELFQAWEHGPVIPDVYHRYKDYGTAVIPASEASDDSLGLSDDEIDTLNQAFSVFGSKTAWALRELSHREQPWIDAFNEGQNTNIDKKQTMDCFKEKYLNG